MSWHLKLGTIINNTNANPIIDNFSHKFSLFCELFFEEEKPGKNVLFSSEIIIFLCSKKKKNGEKQLTDM
jgi:hypothetical protein